MRSILTTLFIVLIGYVLASYLHWLASFAAPLIGIVTWPVSTKKAIIVGALSLFVLWSGCATLLDISNQHLLSKQIGDLFGGMSHWTLIVITGIVGAIGGALSGWIASQVILIKK